MVSSTRWQYVLLPASETFETPTAIVLPEGSEDEELQGLHYSTAFKGGRLFWSSLLTDGVALAPNAAASVIAGISVRGDAVLAVPHEHTTEQLSRLLARCSITPLIAAECARPCHPGVQQQAAERKQHLAQRVLRQVPGPAALGDGACLQPSERPVSAAGSTLRRLPRQKSSTAPAQHGTRIHLSEPRQALMFRLMGQATSISWDGKASVSRGASSQRVSDAQGTPPPGVAGAGATWEAARADGGAWRPEEGEPLQGAPHSGTHGPPVWSSLGSEVLAMVVLQAGHGADFAQLVRQVCVGWRRALGEESTMLKALRFGGLSRGQQLLHRAPLPMLAIQAIAAGNTEAAIAAARLHDSEGDHAGALRLWGRAARQGHPEGQWHLGLAYHKGLCGFAHDAEESLLWVSRAARQLLAVVHPAQLGASSGGGGVPPLMTRDACAALLAHAALLLGCLHLDGEATRQDTGVAIRWLKVAEAHGCSDAGLIKGALFNTGQY